jgi:predicted transposase/invertase (TIGR01784 family)
MVRIWELYLKQHKKAGTLPVILPIVIYHGSTNWRVDKNFMSLFSAPDYVKEFIPDFEYNLRDISHLPDEEIKGEVFVQVMLKTLKYTFNPDLKQKLPEILQLFGELKDKNKGTEYLEVLLRYLGGGMKFTGNELRESVKQILEEGGDLMTIVEKWMKEEREKGMEKGMEKGLEKGMEKGMRKGMRQVTMEVIKNSLKAGLSTRTIERITGLSVDDINRLKEKMAKEDEKAARKTH